MAEELEKTETVRMDFINNLSHEFKTPIVSIAGFAKVLKKDITTATSMVTTTHTETNIVRAILPFFSSV